MVRHLRSICGPMLILCCAAVSGSCVTDEPSGDAVATAATEQKASVQVASAVLRDANGVAQATVLFTSAGSGTLVTVAARSTAGIHGFHVHANDNPANGDGCIADPAQPANTHFVSADGHFNPTGQTHGNHGGDTPGVNVLSDGSALLTYTHELVLADITGRAVILHEGMDNFGNIPLGTAANQYTANSQDAITATQNTGNAGNRIACGVIQ